MIAIGDAIVALFESDEGDGLRAAGIHRLYHEEVADGTAYPQVRFTIDSNSGEVSGDAEIRFECRSEANDEGAQLSGILEGLKHLIRWADLSGGSFACSPARIVGESTGHIEGFWMGKITARVGFLRA